MTKYKGFHLRKRGKYYSAYKMRDGKQVEIGIGTDKSLMPKKIDNYLQKTMWVEEDESLYETLNTRITALEKEIKKCKRKS